MTTLRLSILFVLLNFSSSAQIDLAMFAEDWCPCFEKIRDSEIRDCISINIKVDYNRLTAFLNEPSNSIRFIKEIGNNCLNFREYLENKWGTADNLSDQEVDRRVFDALGYFTVISSLDTLPKQVVIDNMETGLVFNIFRNRIRKDQFLDSGVHEIAWQDSVITFSSAEQNLTSNFECTEEQGSVLRIEATVKYRLRRETLSELYENMGQNYEKVILEPKLRLVMSSHCNNFISRENHSNKGIDTSVYLDQLSEGLIGDYFFFEGLTIKSK